MQTKPFYDILIKREIKSEYNTKTDKFDNINTITGRIRIYDGENWDSFYYPDLLAISELESKAKTLVANYSVINEKNILQHIELLGSQNVKLSKFSYEDYCKISNDDKIEVLNKVKRCAESIFDFYYKDYYLEVIFMTENITRTYNLCAYGIGAHLLSDSKSLFQTKTYHSFYDLGNDVDYILSLCEMMVKATKCKVKIKQAKFDLIFSPSLTGVLAHECFGHIFESDIRYEEDIGEDLTKNIDVTIIDDGNVERLGYCPFDDDGIINKSTTIIKNGKINNYLSDLVTSKKHRLIPSGNGRSVDLNYEIITRMTNTFMKPTEYSTEKIFNSIDGIYVIAIQHAEVNENSELLIYPTICRKVENGNMADWIEIDYIKIDINELYQSILMIGDDLQFDATLFGGCGKFGQDHLLVSQGGPHIALGAVPCF